jgi:nucleoside-diphosphate-sugar epimerase
MTRIFIAGATGVIGARLAQMLSDAGHQVTGMTRSAKGEQKLLALGAEPVVVDIFDAEGVVKAMQLARPEVVVHQLTDLPDLPEPERLKAALPRNARIRDEGTANLVRAAIAASAEYVVAQSIAWAYEPGPEPHSESDPLDVEAKGDTGITVRGIIALERQILNSPPLKGAVLRYGQLYGAGTYSESPRGPVPVHVDAAAHAALLAIERRVTGVLNIAEPNDRILTEKAYSELGWDPGYRIPV